MFRGSSHELQLESEKSGLLSAQLNCHTEASPPNSGTMGQIAVLLGKCVCVCALFRSKMGQFRTQTQVESLEGFQSPDKIVYVYVPFPFLIFLVFRVFEEFRGR